MVERSRPLISLPARQLVSVTSLELFDVNGKLRTSSKTFPSITLDHLSYSPNGTRLCALAYKLNPGGGVPLTTLMLFDAETLGVIQEAPLADFGVWAIEFSAESHSIVVVSHQLDYYDGETLKHTAVYPRPIGYPFASALGDTCGLLETEVRSRFGIAQCASRPGWSGNMAKDRGHCSSSCGERSHGSSLCWLFAVDAGRSSAESVASPYRAGGAQRGHADAVRSVSSLCARFAVCALRTLSYISLMPIARHCRADVG